MRRCLILRKARRLDREVLIPFFPFLVKSVHAVWTRKRQKTSVAQQRCELNDRGPETVDTLRNLVHGDDDTTASSSSVRVLLATYFHIDHRSSKVDTTPSIIRH